MTDRIVLVNPPFFDVERPSIALGILKSILERGNHATSVIYANLLYAERVGLARYQLINRARAELVLGDWLFARVAFPEWCPDPDQYLRRIALDDGWAGRRSDLLQHVVDLRSQVGEYVDDVVRRILDLNPRIVGCTSTFCQHVAALAILKRVRAADPSIVTILGGANCEAIMGETTHRKFPWVDYVVSGEAEDLIVNLCSNALKWGANIPSDRLPPGVLSPFHRSSGYPRTPNAKGPVRATASDINAIPTPDYSDYFASLARSKYQANISPTLLMESSRGCWWGKVSHCTFCGLNGDNMVFRSKTARLVLDQIDELIRLYGTKRIEMVDNILDHHYFESLFPELVASPRNASIFYEVKSNLSRTRVELLAKAGVYGIQPGIESLDTRVLQLMKKGVSALQNVRLLKWARQYGVSATWSTIVGFPGEQDAWYAEASRLLPAIIHLQPGGFHLLRYDRFSPYHADPVKFGLSLEPYWHPSQVYPLEQSELKDLVYFFEDKSGLSRKSERELLADRPGCAQYFSLNKAWAAAWARPPRPVCTVVERNGVRRLCDTRPAFAVGTETISPLTDHVLRVADEGVPVNCLAKKCCESRSWSAAAVEKEIERQIECGLIVVLDGKALSIVLRAPVPSLYSRPTAMGTLSMPILERE